MPKVIDETRLFNAALDLLVSHGYDGATTQRIADLAGVNEVTLFRRYGSKAGLFEKAIERRLSDTPLNKLVYTGDLEADLLSIVGAYLETNETHGDIVTIVLIELPRNPDLQGSFDVPWKNIQRTIEIIRNYQVQGVLKQESALASLSALIGPLMVNQMFRRTNLNLPLPVTDPQEHVASYLRGREI